MKTILSITFLLCGSAQALIIGGLEMNAHDPLQQSTAAMYEPSGNGAGGSLCTASLIGKNTALTAAHCVQKGSYAPMMIFGSNVRSADSVHLPITGIAVNPTWEKNRGRGMDQGDIAVVKFQGKLPPGYHAATLDSPKNEIKKGESVILAGYGVSNARTHEGSGILRKTSVSVAAVRKGKSEMIFDQSHGRGACHGDSGGPAYLQRGQKMILAGVTNRSYPNSASDDCAHKVVYTKVAAYRPWIEKSENELNNNPIPVPHLASLSSSNTSRTLSKQVTKKVLKKSKKSGILHKIKQETPAKHPKISKQNIHGRLGQKSLRKKFKVSRAIHKKSYRKKPQTT